jgi:hypothetical protein
LLNELNTPAWEDTALLCHFIRADPPPILKPMLNLDWVALLQTDFFHRRCLQSRI